MSETPIQPVGVATMNSTPSTTVFGVCNTIYIKNLNYKTTRQTLEWIFEKYGKITNLTIKNKTNPKGIPMMFSFVTYETEEQATNAMNAMNGRLVEGRILTVKYGKPLGTEPIEHKPSIKVSNLHFRIKNEQLKQIFAKYNPLNAEVKLVNKGGKIQSTGIGIIELPDEQTQELAVAEMNNTYQEGRQITVEKKEQKVADKQAEEKPAEKQEKVQKFVDPCKKTSSTKIIVQNLQFKIREAALFEMFKKFNAIKATVVTEKQKNGRIHSKGFGFVEFKDVEDQELAIMEMNNTEHEGQFIIVKKALETIKLEPELIKYKIPIKSYYLNETFTMEVKGQQYKVNLKPDVRPGKQFKVEKAGTPIDDVPRDLIIELDVEDNELYRIDKDDLYHTTCFSKQHAGQTHLLDLTLVDGTPYKTKAVVRDGEKITLMRYGLKNAQGTRGDYYIIIKLQ